MPRVTAAFLLSTVVLSGAAVALPATAAPPDPVKVLTATAHATQRGFTHATPPTLPDSMN